MYFAGQTSCECNNPICRRRLQIAEKTSSLPLLTFTHIGLIVVRLIRMSENIKREPKHPTKARKVLSTGWQFALIGGFHRES